MTWFFLLWILFTGAGARIIQPIFLTSPSEQEQIFLRKAARDLEEMSSFCLAQFAVDHSIFLKGSAFYLFGLGLHEMLEESLNSPDQYQGYSWNMYMEDLRRMLENSARKPEAITIFWNLVKDVSNRRLRFPISAGLLLSMEIELIVGIEDIDVVSSMLQNNFFECRAFLIARLMSEPIGHDILNLSHESNHSNQLSTLVTFALSHIPDSISASNSNSVSDSDPNFKFTPYDRNRAIFAKASASWKNWIRAFTVVNFIKFNSLINHSNTQDFFKTISKEIYLALNEVSTSNQQLREHVAFGFFAAMLKSLNPTESWSTLLKFSKNSDLAAAHKFIFNTRAYFCRSLKGSTSLFSHPFSILELIKPSPPNFSSSLIFADAAESSYSPIASLSWQLLFRFKRYFSLSLMKSIFTEISAAFVDEFNTKAKAFPSEFLPLIEDLIFQIKSHQSRRELFKSLIKANQAAYFLLSDYLRIKSFDLNGLLKTFLKTRSQTRLYGQDGECFDATSLIIYAANEEQLYIELGKILVEQDLLWHDSSLAQIFAHEHKVPFTAIDRVLNLLRKSRNDLLAFFNMELSASATFSAPYYDVHRYLLESSPNTPSVQQANVCSGAIDLFLAHINIPVLSAILLILYGLSFCVLTTQI